jgi:hypothetical protein
MGPGDARAAPCRLLPGHTPRCPTPVPWRGEPAPGRFSPALRERVAAAARRALAFDGEAKRAFAPRRFSVAVAHAAPARLPCASCDRAAPLVLFAGARTILADAAQERSADVAHSRIRRRSETRVRISPVFRARSRRARPAPAHEVNPRRRSCSSPAPGRFSRTRLAAWRVLAFDGESKRAFASRRFCVPGHAVPARLPCAS